MVRTLQTAGILVLLLSGLFLYPAVFGTYKNAGAEALLSKPGAVEKFKQASGVKSESGQEPPLVKEARAFALYLNPPPPPKPVETEASAIPQIEDTQFSQKFKLVGTSYLASNPELSMALIEEPSGLKWVKQSYESGHLRFKEIHDGYVVIEEGGKTYDLQIEKTEKPVSPDLIKKGPEPATKTQPAKQPIRGSSGKSRVVRAGAKGVPNPGTTAPTAEQAKQPEQPVEKDASMEEILAKMAAMGIDVNESGKLKEMGEGLKEKKAGEANEVKKDTQGETTAAEKTTTE